MDSTATGWSRVCILRRGGVSCSISAAWHSTVAAHWSKYHCYEQAPSWYDLRCLKATLHLNKQNKVSQISQTKMIDVTSACQHDYLVNHDWVVIIVDQCLVQVRIVHFTFPLFLLHLRLYCTVPGRLASKMRGGKINMIESLENHCVTARTYFNVFLNGSRPWILIYNELPIMQNQHSRVFNRKMFIYKLVNSCFPGSCTCW